MTPVTDGSNGLILPQAVELPTIRLAVYTSECEAGLDHAVIKLTLPYVMDLLNKMSIAAICGTDSNFYRVTYFDYAVSYYKYLADDLESHNWENEQQQTAMEDQLYSFEWFELPDCMLLNDPSPTACETCSIGVEDVIWKASAKHGSGRVETDTMTREQLAGYAKRLIQMATLQTTAPAGYREQRVIQL